MPKFLISVLLIANGIIAFAQVSISPIAAIPDPSSMLDISAPGKGLLVPRMTLAQRSAISLPANALLIYQTNQNPGFYYNKGTPIAPEWIMLPGISDGNIHLEDRIPIDSLPYTISSPGSYYVTSHLSGPIGITISVSNITLDLNGYSLVGTPGNTSEGIKVTNAATNICIRNGGVALWGKEGIKATLATVSRFADLNIVSNAYDGLGTGSHSTAINITAGSNGFDGIDMGENAVLINCTAANNQNDGIEADAGSSLGHCAARNNTQNGIRTTGASVIANCTASENTVSGFSCGTGSSITGSSATGNGQNGFYLFSATTAQHNTSRDNGLHGFEWLSNCALLSNTASLNANCGFSTTFGGSTIDNNTSTSNSLHGYNIQNATGVCKITRNSAAGNIISTFNVIAGNVFATVITAANVNSNTNPFANFQL